MCSPRRVAAAAVLCSLLASAPAAAAGVSFTIGDVAIAPGTGEQVILHIAPQYAQQGLGPDLEAQLATAVRPGLQGLEASIDQRLATLNFTGFLRAMANAAAASANLLPLDHGGEPSLLSLGAAVGGALNARGTLDTTRIAQGLVAGDVPDLGVGGALALTLGLRLELLHLPPLGFVDFDRLGLELSAVAVDLGALANGLTPGGVRDLAAPYLHLGLHGQYLALRGHSLLRGGLLRWGGLQVGTGVHYSRLAVTFAGALPGGSRSQDFLWQGVQAKLLASWKGSATLHADFHTVSVPLQASTSLQLLYLLTVFGGVAGELNFGGSALALDGREPARVDIVTQAGETLQIAAPQAQLSADSAGRPTLGDLRVFAGAQINLWALALYAQASADTARSLALAIGARLFW